MLKNISNLGKTLNTVEQKGINGGARGPLKPIVCNSPYLNSGGTCQVGYHPHPTQGHCVCCKD